MTAFRKVKPTCVQLMSISTQAPTTTSRHARLLTTLASIVRTLPSSAFTPSLINYVIFPLTTTLRQTANPAALPDTFLEAAFRLLSLMVEHWRAVPGGMDTAAWEQLWRFTVSAIGPRGKGKDREVGQEVQLDAFGLLSVLLEPHIEAGVVHPTPAMRRATSGPKAPLMPTLFQTITFAVDCVVPSPPHPALQRSAVRLTRTLIGYLAGQSAVLASALPGIVSAMSKGIVSLGKALKGDVGAEMAGTIQDVVTETLDDDALRGLGVLRPQFNDLSEVVDGWERGDMADRPSPTLSATPSKQAGGSPTAPDTSSKSTDPFPPLTASYLEFTGARLQSTIPPVLAALTGHNSDLARRAAVSLAYAVIDQCHEALPRLLPPALTTLLLLSQDDFDPVRDDALSKIHRLLQKDRLDGALLDLLSSAINALPRLIRSANHTKVTDAARLVTAIAKVTSTQGSTAIAQLLGRDGNVERWAWALLDCLELDRPRGWSSAVNPAHRAAELGWGGSMVSSKMIEGDGSSESPYPHLQLRYVEAEGSARALASMLESLGAAGGEAGLHSIDYFIRFAKAHRLRDPAKAASAVWVVQRLLAGVASTHDEMAPRAVRKMARQVARTLVAMDDDEDEDTEWDGEMGDPADAEALVPVERSRGLDTITTVLDKAPRNTSAVAETARLQATAQRVLLNALSLSTLAECASILGEGFRPLLLHALYAILAALSSPHDLVRSYAGITLERVAHESGYTSAQKLVLDNVDYVVNVVSQRLTYHRLSPHAPLVLIAMIRLVGAPIVPLVHDVVDEIFDALDDFHGYTALASALLAVLTTIIDVMAADTAASGPTEERSAARADARRFLDPPNPQRDFSNFTTWYRARGEMARVEQEEIIERVPRGPLGKYAEGAKEEEEKEEKMNEDKPDESTPPTRSQEVAAQILAKAGYYLSHASPFLRARVLGLIARAIPVLAQAGREGDLLPVIDGAWSAIMARLDDGVPYVVSEAAAVIASLCEYVGEYVSRRVADDAWPRMSRILRTTKLIEAKTSLKGTYTVAHRLYLSLMATAKFIAAEVPVKEDMLWDMMLVFRPFLDHTAEREIQDRAVELYSALGARDGDALWVALGGTEGSVGGVWAYLRDEKLEIAENAVRVLAEDGEGEVEEIDLGEPEEPEEPEQSEEPEPEYTLDAEFELD
ncbi:hypothetical protein CspeluHIS016_0204520 [Cutaneotrichosporon spelunceum]|uniref:Armadillo-type protein n=1 Tax=Cutaneotrichosporon spelunceum TaxID=1672016 RepID=A0AAD3TRW7_9TREE|nr:hypothetical protein CspeluHIS016_0204520 [Cutaneotrichosporon spelunceum]